MSYAFHWERPEEIEEDLYAEMRRDMLAVLEALPETYPQGKGAANAQGQPIELADPSGQEPFSAEELEADDFGFNGLGPRLGESFTFPRVGQDGSFCKTGREPYELAVFGCALVAQYHLPSDFGFEDWLGNGSWDPALDLFEEVMGEGALEEVVEGWCERRPYLALQLLFVQPEGAGELVSGRTEELLGSDRFSPEDGVLLGHRHPRWAEEHYSPELVQWLVRESLESLPGSRGAAGPIDVSASDAPPTLPGRVRPPGGPKHRGGPDPSASTLHGYLGRRFIEQVPELFDRSLTTEDFEGFLKFLAREYSEGLTHVEAGAESLVKALAAAEEESEGVPRVGRETFVELLQETDGPTRERAMRALVRWNRARKQLGMPVEGEREGRVESEPEVPTRGRSRG